MSKLEDMNFKGMHFGISYDVGHHYKPSTRICRGLQYKKYIHALKRQVLRDPKDFIEKPFKRYAYITGRVKKNVLRSLDKYLLLLDADSKDGRAKATEWLDKKEIQHFCIQSSPNRYWIIGNRINTVREHTYLMDEIPGIDTRYTDCCRSQDCLLYRGFPKPGFLPEFEDVSKFTGETPFENWILMFKKYWESEDMMEISHNLFVEII